MGYLKDFSINFLPKLTISKRRSMLYFSFELFRLSFQLQEELDGISLDIMKLGLLYETEMDTASVHERSTYVCFKHPLLQEYSGAYYIFI